MIRIGLPIALLLLLAACDDEIPTHYPPVKLEKVFSDSTYQLTGVAISKTGRLFTCYPYWSDIYQYAVVEIKDSVQKTPYPDVFMNSWKPGDNGLNKWVCAQAVYRDDENYLWVVDPASPKMQGVYQNSHKLVKINLADNSVLKTYSFAGVADEKSYVNDVRVDTKSKTAYLTNSNEGGILVVDLASGQSRQVLQGCSCVHTDSSYHFTVDGRELYKNGQVYKTQSDGIALTPDGQYLYFKPLTDDKLYRIKTAWLQDSKLSEAQLEAKVEYLGRYTTTDGMIFDKYGNLYLGDIEHYRIMRIDPKGSMTELIRDDRLIWPDSYSIDEEGYLYISCSQIQKQPDFNGGKSTRTSPYTIYRLHLPSYY
jgi:sugar lactone lactonase YvrE